jgi:hypothetical protein
LKRTSTLYGILLGVMLLLPILFAKQLSSYVNGWLWPAIPVLPETNITGGLEFDGKDDYVQAGPFDWPYPQFTIEAFVTSEESSDNGTIAYLTSWGDAAKLEWMSLYDAARRFRGRRRMLRLLVHSSEESVNIVCWCLMAITCTITSTEFGRGNGTHLLTPAWSGK